MLLRQTKVLPPTSISPRDPAISLPNTATLGVSAVSAARPVVRVCSEIRPNTLRLAKRAPFSKETFGTLADEQADMCMCRQISQLLDRQIDRGQQSKHAFFPEPEERLHAERDPPAADE